jgi:hypothetical protein
VGNSLIFQQVYVQKASKLGIGQLLHIGSQSLDFLFQAAARGQPAMARGAQWLGMVI